MGGHRRISQTMLIPDGGSRFSRCEGGESTGASRTRARKISERLKK
jgi:hypothetical protein